MNRAQKRQDEREELKRLKEERLSFSKNYSPPKFMRVRGNFWNAKNLTKKK